MNVLHIATIPSDGKPRYRVKAMQFVPHEGRSRQRAPSFDDLTKAGTKVLVRDGIERVREILGEFGSPSISGVPLENRAGLLTAFNDAWGSVPNKLSRMDRFAEHLARGSSIAAASAAVGVSAPYGNSIMQRIRKRLGPQAC